MKRTLYYLLTVVAASALFFSSCNKDKDINGEDPGKEKAVATLTAASLTDAVAAMYSEWEENTTIAEKLTVGSTELTLPQYQFAMCKLLVNLSKNDKSDIKVLNYKAADHPERDSYDKDEIAVVGGPANGENTEDLVNIATRMLASMAESSKVPNVTLFERNEPISFSTNRATVCLARAIAAYKADGKLPAKVATEYLSAGNTLQGFAKEFVKILDVWQSHVGQIESDGRHSVDSKNPWVDVHFIPTHTTTFPESAENKEDETKITVGENEYDMEQCWTIAAQGIINMITVEGTTLTPTVQNVREHTLGDGKDLTQPIPQAPEMIPWQHPFYELEGLLNLSSVNPFKTEHFAAILPWWYMKSTLSNGRVTNFANLGSYGISGYKGEMSAMRMLLCMARYYKYLLDNNITKNVWTATKDLVIDHDLYGVKPVDIILQTGEEISFEATPTGAITVKFAANTAWTATTTTEWIHLDPASGAIENPASLNVTVDANTGEAREGTITIKGEADEVTVTVKQLAYVAPSSATLKDFAKEFVKILDVWAANVGTIQPDGQHQGDKRFFNVHYIPTWSEYSAEVTDNVSQPETTITVGTETYTMYDAWAVAAKGLVEILTKEGMETVPTTQNVFAHTLGQGKGLDIPVPAKNATWNKWKYPWYEDNGLTLSAEKPMTVEMLAQILPWWLMRAATLDSGKGRIGNYQYLSNFGFENFPGEDKDMICPMRILLIMARLYKHILDNNIETNVYEAVKGMAIDHDLYGEGIPAASAANMKAFAKEFVKFLDVWQSHVGTIEADGKHSIDSKNPWTNVHYIPTYSDYPNSDNNKEAEATITVGDKTYKVFEAWDIAIKGFVEMVTLEGTTTWPTALNSPVHTLGNGKPLTMDIPELEADKWNKCKYPWYQNEGAANFDAEHPVNMEVLRRVLPYWLNRARQLDSNVGRIGNYQDMSKSGLEGYTGLMCPMQSLLILCRFYKYLLDNNIESNVYDAVKDQTFDPELYAQEAAPVFADDFEWMNQWAVDTNAPDDVGTNTVGSSPNIFTNEKLTTLLAELQTRGYGYVWGWKDQAWSDGTPDDGNKKTLYLDKNYLKFGKTSYSSGIILPALKDLTAATDVTLTFDWCWCKTSSNNPDLMTLTVTVSGGGTIEATGTETSGEIESGQSKENPTKLEWQHASVKIKGATATTRITIRPTNNDPDVSNSARHQNRWYLDNIVVK